MTTQQFLVIDDNIYDLASYATLVEEDGLGMPPTTRFSRRAPQQHGQLDVGFRLEPRTITLTFIFKQTTLSDYYVRRKELLALFAPRKKPIGLMYVLDDGTSYQIDCHYSGEMSFSSQGRSITSHKFSVQLYCPDPTWYNPVPQAERFALGGGGQTMNIPLAIPWQVGSSTIDQTVQVTYNGTWETYPIITVTGPCTDLVVANETLDLTLSFPGHEIADGEVYTIDTRFGAKSVVNASGISQIEYLESVSALATFRIAPASEVEGGVNVFRVQASEITSNTQVAVRFLERHLGF